MKINEAYNSDDHLIAKLKDVKYNFARLPLAYIHALKRRGVTLGLINS
jgi:hypothetical protein